MARRAPPPRRPGSPIFAGLAPASFSLRQILHVSDLHFGPPHLPAVARGLEALIADRRPDLVVISGDLTQRAKPHQFREARHFVDRLPVPCVAVPGNHDVPLYRVWERALVPFGAYRKHFDRDLEPVWSDPELQVVGLNTAYNWTFKNGHVSRRQLSRLAERLAAGAPGALRVVVAHHHLIAPPEFSKHKPVAGSRRIVDALTAAGADVILSGHLHLTYRASSEDFHPFGRRGALILHSGTTTSNRRRHSERDQNTCNWLRIDAEAIEVSHLRWQPASESFAVEGTHRHRRSDLGLEPPG